MCLCPVHRQLVQRSDYARLGRLAPAESVGEGQRLIERSAATRGVGGARLPGREVEQARLKVLFGRHVQRGAQPAAWEGAASDSSGGSKHPSPNAKSTERDRWCPTGVGC